LQEAEQENHPGLEEFKKMFTIYADEKKEDASGAVAYLWKSTKWYNDSDSYLYYKAGITNSQLVYQMG
jgi:hypothetical protein